VCENVAVRSAVAVLAALMTSAAVIAAPPAAADDECDYPSCTPGIMPGAVLGADCDQTTFYSFGVTSWGRLVFCGSPRRYDPRWFRSPVMVGVKNMDDLCPAMDGDVAQGPDGMFLTCVASDGASRWVRGDT
jgi:hypothetical protein